MNQQKKIIGRSLWNASLPTARLIFQNLESVFPALTGSNPYRILQICHKDFTVANLPGLSSLQNRVNDHLQIVIGTNDLDFYFGNKVDRILGTTIDFRVTLLTPEASDFAHRHPMDPLICQGIFDVFQLEVTHNGFDFFHDSYLSPGKSCCSLENHCTPDRPVNQTGMKLWPARRINDAFLANIVKKRCFRETSNQIRGKTGPLF